LSLYFGFLSLGDLFFLEGFMANDNEPDYKKSIEELAGFLEPARGTNLSGTILTDIGAIAFDGPNLFMCAGNMDATQDQMMEAIERALGE
jgi:hypothetical protein